MFQINDSILSTVTKQLPIKYLYRPQLKRGNLVLKIISFYLCHRIILKTKNYEKKCIFN